MVTFAQLASASAPACLHQLRETGAVVWVDALDGWLVVGRDVAVKVLRDAATFTVDDDRFSTAVVVGTSMLSTDGDDHARHRAPFAAPFTGPAVNSNYARLVVDGANRAVASLADRGSAELRSELAGPLAVTVIVEALGLVGVDETDVLQWYRAIVAGVDRVSTGLGLESATGDALSSLRGAIDESSRAQQSLIADASSWLTGDELFANTAVLMFGAIETSEGMTANALWHLLTVPGLVELVADDRSYVAELVEESLRLEPAAAVVDRYATRNTEIGGADVTKGDLVRVSLSGANRDPAVFDDPDRFDIDRSNSRQHLAFVQGPHVCLGLHLARAQTAAVVNAVLDQLLGISLDTDTSTPPSGLIFRKPATLRVTWEASAPPKLAVGRPRG